MALRQPATDLDVRLVMTGGVQHDGPKMVAGEYDRDDVVDRTEALYRDLLRRGRMP